MQSVQVRWNCGNVLVHKQEGALVCEKENIVNLGVPFYEEKI